MVFGESTTIETLIAFGADIYVIGAQTLQTVLMFAVQRAHVDAVRLLLSLNADTTKTNVEGKTALQYAGEVNEIKQLFAEHELKLVC